MKPKYQTTVIDRITYGRYREFRIRVLEGQILVHSVTGKHAARPYDIYQNAAGTYWLKPCGYPIFYLCIQLTDEQVDGIFDALIPEVIRQFVIRKPNSNIPV